MTRAIPIVLVDDHPVVRDGLAFLLGEQRDFRVVGQAADADTALQVIRRTRPALLVLDINLQGQDAIGLVTRLREELPALRILILSMHEEDLYAERLLGLGAHGYVMKQEEPAEFLRALRRVAAGEIHLSPKLTGRILGRVGRGARGAAPLAQLTSREHDVLRLVARGLGTREIAVELGMGPKTVDSHRRNIRDKLGLATSRDLVRYAVRWAAGSEDGAGASP
jgi:DNA-binding NarL/FixJ family response regulator